MRDTWKTILIGCLAIVSLVAANSAGKAAILLMLVGIWLAVWAGFLAVDQVIERLTIRQEQANSWRTRTEAVRKLEIIQRYSNQQLEALGGYMPFIEALGGSHGPVLTLRVLGDKTVMLDFVYSFLDECNERNLLPIRDAGKRLGSKYSNAREQAELLTDYLVFHGFATAGAGPTAAQWVDGGIDMARRWVGYGMVQVAWRNDNGCQVPENRIKVERGFKKAEESWQTEG